MVADLNTPRPLGRSAVSVSPLGLGTARLGNLYSPIDDAVAKGIVDAARSVGVNYFDTAPHYGLGLAERRLGEALASPSISGTDAAGVVVSTKVGRILEPVDNPGADDDMPNGFAVPATCRRRWDFSRDGVLRSLDDSRRRLRRDRIDIVYLHDPDDHLKLALDEALPTLVELRAAGIVGAIGAGMNSSVPLTRFVKTGEIDVVLLAGRYTLLEQDALDDLLPAAIASRTSVVVGGVFNSGLLARATVPDNAPYNYRPASIELLERARRLAAICNDHGTTLPAAAVQFPLAHPAVASVLVGAGSAQEMVDDDAYHRTTVPQALWSALIGEGLLRGDTPLPPAHSAATISAPLERMDARGENRTDTPR